MGVGRSVWLSSPRCREANFAVRHGIPDKVKSEQVRYHARVVRLTPLVMAVLSMAAAVSANSAGVPQGVWLVDPDSAVQIFDCNGLLCGRVVWLRHARDPAGQIQRDKKNPVPASRPRLVCGLTALWGLRPDGPGRWRDGWFYNPDDGETYSVTAELRSADVIEARIYKILPMFGMTKTLARVPRLSSEGWC